MKIENTVFRLSREASSARLGFLAQCESVAVQEAPATQPEHRFWCALVLLAGPVLRLTFKASYRADDVRSFAAPVLGQKSAEISATAAHDFMKEYCNLTAGGIQAELQSQLQISASLSLPLVIRGFDDTFWASPDQIRTFKDLWVLQAGPASLVCSMYLEKLGSLE